MPIHPLLYRDDTLVVTHKPSGHFVHRSALDPHVTDIMLQELRDQLGQWVYPVHRLDRPTSGLMLFALSSDHARTLARQFEAHTVEKRYLAIVRGFGPDETMIDRALREEDGHRPKKECPAMPARTLICRRDCVEWPARIDRFDTSRFSLMEALPVTGRRHQIRRHLSHAGHPIIGDAKHGKGIYNRYVAEHLGCQRLLLAATHLAFDHPFDGRRITIDCPVADDMARLMTRFGWAEHIGAVNVQQYARH
ncbi:pseudouridine synthase [Larsenimonas salina]|uniref:pseudouridine synthase n=1 Tax=Larsenimonas salina TaxID=1295565 RepID=UPI0020739883|nr:pseudouridine synthase [Larsenimonas salina]MCM5704335.1 pseudouridine synthase [Larsenimonas salina]